MCRIRGMSCGFPSGDPKQAHEVLPARSVNSDSRTLSQHRTEGLSRSLGLRPVVSFRERVLGFFAVTGAPQSGP